MKNKKVNALVKLILTTPFLFVLIIGNTSCGDDTDNGSEPIPQTYTIEFEEKGLTFEVKYEALPGVVPEYLSNLEDQLEVFVDSDVPTNVAAVNNLINNGGSDHVIVVEYTGESYEGLIYNAATRTFTIHNDWISDNDFAFLFSNLRTVFNSVEPLAMLRMNSRNVAKNFDLAKEFHMAFHGNLNTLL